MNIHNQNKIAVFSSHRNMPSLNLSRTPTAADQEKFWDLLYATPMIERGKPIAEEMFWVLHDRPNPDQHQKRLPDYCYNILDVLRKTYFRAFPSMSDTMVITDPIGAPLANTLEATKKVMRLDWKNLGRLFGIAIRGIRFAQVEVAENNADLKTCTLEETTLALTAIRGQQWVEANRAELTAKPLNLLMAEQLNEFIEPWITKTVETRPQFEVLAYRWEPGAMVSPSG